MDNAKAVPAEVGDGVALAENYRQDELRENKCEAGRGGRGGLRGNVGTARKGDIVAQENVQPTPSQANTCNTNNSDVRDDGSG